MAERTCIVCGSSLDDRRPTARTCSAICRKRLQREHEQIERLVTTAVVAMNALRVAARDSNYPDEAIAALLALVNVTRTEYARAETQRLNQLRAERRG